VAFPPESFFSCQVEGTPLFFSYDKNPTREASQFKLLPRFLGGEDLTVFACSCLSCSSRPPDAPGIPSACVGRPEALLEITGFSKIISDRGGTGGEGHYFGVSALWGTSESKSTAVRYDFFRQWRVQSAFESRKKRESLAYRLVCR
jgi:hypothetical protein